MSINEVPGLIFVMQEREENVQVLLCLPSLSPLSLHQLSSDHQSQSPLKAWQEQILKRVNPTV